jgi:hypothetical protein
MGILTYTKTMTLENQASNKAFQVAGIWHSSSKDRLAQKRIESEKEIILCSYTSKPEYAEKFNAVLAYYMIRENYIQVLNGTSN